MVIEGLACMNALKIRSEFAHLQKFCARKQNCSHVMKQQIYSFSASSCFVTITPTGSSDARSVTSSFTFVSTQAMDQISVQEEAQRWAAPLRL